MNKLGIPNLDKQLELSLISDMEKVPAYLRRSIELDEVKQSNAKGNLSEYTIGVEDELGHLRTSNSFLHNNAD